MKKNILLNNVSKEWLWEQLDAVEDERNKLLWIAKIIYTHIDSKEILTEEERNIIELLESVGCR